MTVQKSDLLALIQAQAEHEARTLASEFVRAAEMDREAILAGLEFEQWLAAGGSHCEAGTSKRRWALESDELIGYNGWNPAAPPEKVAWTRSLDRPFRFTAS